MMTPKAQTRYTKPRKIIALFVHWTQLRAGCQPAKHGKHVVVSLWRQKDPSKSRFLLGTVKIPSPGGIAIAKASRHR